jgi:hypothetical protein
MRKTGSNLLKSIAAPSGEPKSMNSDSSAVSRSHLKKVLSSDIGVEPSSQVLDILEYACGLILGLALISTENPNFEMVSN